MQIKDEDSKEHDFQIAPMVDVVFMLIIFFMLSAALKANEDVLKLTLPGPGPVPRDKLLEPIELTIREDGRVLLYESQVGKPGDQTLEELKARLSRAIELFGAKQPVTINPSPHTPHGRVIDVVDACAAAKVRALSFAR